MTKVRQAVINIFSGGAGYLVPMLVNLITTPFLLHRLGEAAFGIQVIANVIVGYLIVADMGLDIPITQRIATANSIGNKVEQGKFLLATLKLYVLIGTSGMIVLFSLTNFLIDWLIIPQEFRSEAKYVFYLSAVGFLGSIIGMWGKAVFNGFHRYDIANGVNIVCNLVAIGIGLMLVYNGYGIVGFIAARMLGFFASAITYISLTLKYILVFDFFPFIDKHIWGQLKRQIGFGVLLRLSGMLFSRMDQTLIGIWVGISSVTIYSFPILIVTTLSGLIASITHFVFPMVSSINASEDKSTLNHLFIKTSKYIALLSGFFFVPFIIFGDKVITLWINENIAAESKDVLTMLSCAFAITTCFNVAMNAFLVGVGMLRNVAYFNLIKGLALLVGFILLIKPFGIEGAAIVYILTSFIDILYSAIMAKRKFGININTIFFKALFKPFCISLITTLSLFPFKEKVQSWVSLFIVMIIYASIFFLFTFFFKVIDKPERETLKKMALKLFRF